MKFSHIARRARAHAGLVLLPLISPLFEKNPEKTKTLSRCHVPMVLSMARVIVLLFAAVMLRQIYRFGIAGWPDATLCISIVLAIPVLGALERVKPAEAVEFGKTVVRRFGVGTGNNRRAEAA
jgi:hypothetical protein